MPSPISRRVALLALVGLLIPPALHAQGWRSVRSAPVGLTSAVVEPLSHRLFVYGAWDQAGQFRDLWSLSLDSLAQWQRVSMIGVGPSPRTDAVLFADPARQQIIAYGGREPSSAIVLTPGSFNDVWRIDLSGRPTWQELDVVNGPGTYGPGYGSTGSAAFDARHGRLLAFGGYVPHNIMFKTNGTWQIDVAAPSSWADLTSSGPSARAYAASAYDSLTDRLVLTGGTVGNNTWMTDSWTRTFPGGSWQPLPQEGAASPRGDRELSWYRGSARKLDILNGSTLYSLDLSRTDVAAWSSQPVVDESGVELEGKAWDDSTHAVWAIDPITANLWRLPLNGSPGWELAMRAPVQPPTNFFGSSIVFDPTSDRTWMMFGFDPRAFSLVTSGLQAKGSRLDDWSTFSVAPPPRDYASVVLDDAHRRLLVFGGASDSTDLADLWEYRIDTQTWAPISAPDGPSPRDEHSAVIDPVNHRMIVFGGQTLVPGGVRQPLSDMWALSLVGAPTWTRLEDAPVQRAGHSAIWDAPRGRMVVVGGAAGNGRDYGDVWQWVPGRTPSWQQAPDTRLPLYDVPQVIHDEQHGVLIMIGQNDPNFAYLRVQPLDLATLEWGASITDETTPPQVGPAYYDPLRRQGVLVQNATAFMLPLGLPSDPRTSLISADGSQGQAVIEWRVVGDPQPLRVRRFRDGAGRADRTFEGIVPDAGDVVRLVDTAVAPGDSFAYTLEADVDGAVRQFGAANVLVDSSTVGPPPPPPPPAPALALHPISPALSRQAQVRCTLPDAAPAKLEAYDITGRRVVEMEVGPRGPGEFTVTLDHRFNAGIYFVRLKHAGATREARLVVLP